MSTSTMPSTSRPALVRRFAQIAALVALQALILFAARTAMEDGTLQRELPGYTEYTQKTRYRLVPGIW